LSGQFFQRRVFAAVDAILGAIDTSHEWASEGFFPGGGH